MGRDISETNGRCFLRAFSEERIDMSMSITVFDGVLWVNVFERWCDHPDRILISGPMENFALQVGILEVIDGHLGKRFQRTYTEGVLGGRRQYFSSTVAIGKDYNGMIYFEIMMPLKPITKFVVLPEVAMNSEANITKQIQSAFAAKTFSMQIRSDIHMAMRETHRRNKLIF